jgi:hypothetical protein
MLPHQQRVVDEKTELDQKIVKLDQFIEGEVFETLPSDEQDRLVKQLRIMYRYFAVLGERIAAFPSQD